MLADSRAAQVVALDFSAAMLSHVDAAHRVRASMLKLPFGAGVFDAVVSGLAVGHAPDVYRWMAEIARVLKPGGVLLYSDFHPEAARAGHSRKFTDENQRTHTVPHHSHSISSQSQAAATAGLTIDSLEELRAGFELSEAFPQSENFYQRWSGWPFVLIVRAQKARA
jgi:malonyl-CoA O-methyltransferase